MLGFLKRRRREKVRATPSPRAWLEILERGMPYYQRLSAEDRAELLSHVHVLLAEKHFEGCGGLELDDEHRVLIAAQAALLLLHRDTDYFPGLTSILVYPDEYVVDEARHLDSGIVQEGPDIYAGHTQERLGALVLSWEDVLASIGDPEDGYNVVLHEFAHQLDFEDGAPDGTPAHDRAAAAQRWRAVLQQELERLRHDVRRRRATVIDPYGAEDPVEFFAVVTEAFFETPLDLRDAHPELYEEFRRFYRQDPAAADEDWLAQQDDRGQR